MKEARRSLWQNLQTQFEAYIEISKRSDVSDAKGVAVRVTYLGSPLYAPFVQQQADFTQPSKASCTTIVHRIDNSATEAKERRYKTSFAGV